MQILVVEDDVRLAQALCRILEESGYKTDAVHDGQSGLDYAESGIYDVVILDVMLPKMDGFTVVSNLRRAGVSTPVLLLTARDAVPDKICGLDSGADDYLAKPFGMMELVSRVNALLRRAQTPAVSADDTLVNGPIELVSSAHTVSVGGTPVALTLKEFDLLRALMRSEGRVLSRGRLLEEVWGVTYVGETRTVDVHIQTLRQKLNAASSGADELIRTVRGVGYTMKSAS